MKIHTSIYEYIIHSTSLDFNNCKSAITVGSTFYCHTLTYLEKKMVIQIYARIFCFTGTQILTRKLFELNEKYPYFDQN